MPSHIDKVLPWLLDSSDGADDATAMAQGLLQGAFADPPASAGAALNMTQLFRFINLVVVPNAAQNFMRSFIRPGYIRDELIAPVATKLATFSNLSTADFEADSQSTKRALDALNAATGGTYDINACTPSPACDVDCVILTSCAPAAENAGVPMAQLDRLRADAMTAIAAERFYSEDAVPMIREEAEAISSHLEKLELALNTVKPSVAIVLHLLDSHAQTSSSGFFRDPSASRSQDFRLRLAPLLRDLEATGATAWLAEGYWSVHESLCDEAKVALSRLSLVSVGSRVPYACKPRRANLLVSVYAPHRHLCRPDAYRRPLHQRACRRLQAGGGLGGAGSRRGPAAEVSAPVRCSRAQEQRPSRAREARAKHRRRRVSSGSAPLAPN
jgi:hypothetical protein